jgi:hypothetical protein
MAVRLQNKSILWHLKGVYIPIKKIKLDNLQL